MVCVLRTTRTGLVSGLSLVIAAVTTAIVVARRITVPVQIVTLCMALVRDLGLGFKPIGLQCCKIRNFWISLLTYLVDKALEGRFSNLILYILLVVVVPLVCNSNLVCSNEFDHGIHA